MPLYRCAPKPAEIFACDIRSGGDDRRALLAFANERFGQIDLLVNNAGMAPRERRDILDATESFDELINVNLKGPHFLTQQVARGNGFKRTGAADEFSLSSLRSRRTPRLSIAPESIAFLRGGLEHVGRAVGGEACDKIGVFEILAGNYSHRHDFGSGRCLRKAHRRNWY